MKNVQVLLRMDVAHLGHIGDVVTVAPGYARNYLLPHRLAVEATPYNVKMMERRATRFAAERAAKEAEVSEQIAALGKVMLRTKDKADETGTLYGSVGAHRIAELLTAEGFPTEEKQVRLDEPIKSVGTHEVPIHVHGEHYAGIQLVVEAE